MTFFLAFHTIKAPSRSFTTKSSSHSFTTKAPSRSFTTKGSRHHDKGSQIMGWNTPSATIKPIGPPIQQNAGWNTNSAKPSGPVGPPIQQHAGWNTQSAHGSNQNIGWNTGSSNHPVGPPAFGGTSSMTHGNIPSPSYHPSTNYQPSQSYYPSQSYQPSQAYHPSQSYNHNPSYSQGYPTSHYSSNHYTHYRPSGNTYINNHYGSNSRRSSPSISLFSALFSTSRASRRRRRQREYNRRHNNNNRRHSCDDQFTHQRYDFNCEDFAASRCMTRKIDNDFCRKNDRYRQLRISKGGSHRNLNNLSKAILPAAAVIGGVAGYALASNLPIRMKRNEPLLVCGEKEGDQALLSLNGTIYECDDNGVALSCPRMLDNSTVINDCENKAFECNKGSMDFDGTPMNCNDGTLISKEPVFCVSISSFNDTSDPAANETTEVLILNCFFGELPKTTVLELTPLPKQIRYPANDKLPMLCSSKTEDQKNYHNIYKNGFFFYCDDKTVKVSCPKMFSNDSSVVDECLNKTTSCDVPGSRSFCRGSRLFTEGDTVCDSTTKYERVNETSIYILNCHEPKENDTQKLSHVAVKTRTTTVPTTTTTTEAPKSLSFAARVHIILLSIMGKAHLLDIPRPSTTTPMPTTTLLPVETTISSDLNRTFILETLTSEIDLNNSTLTLNATEVTEAPKLNSTESVLIPSFNETIESALNTIIAVNETSTVSPYVIVNDVFPTYPESMLLFGIGKSHLWQPTPIEPKLHQQRIQQQLLHYLQTEQLKLI